MSEPLPAPAETRDELLRALLDRALPRLDAMLARLAAAADGLDGED